MVNQGRAMYRRLIAWNGASSRIAAYNDRQPMSGLYTIRRLPPQHAAVSMTFLHVDLILRR